jgi:VanZ family protein
LILTVLWLFFVLVLSVIPVKGVEGKYPTDKVVHFIMYGITAIVFLRNLRSKTSIKKSIVLSIILASSVGFAMEIIQSVIPWRGFSLTDELANVAGAVFVTVLYVLKDFCGEKNPS